MKIVLLVLGMLCVPLLAFAEPDIQQCQIRLQILQASRDMIEQTSAANVVKLLQEREQLHTKMKQLEDENAKIKEDLKSKETSKP